MSLRVLCLWCSDCSGYLIFLLLSHWDDSLLSHPVHSTQTNQAQLERERLLLRKTASDKEIEVISVQTERGSIEVRVVFGRV